MQMCDFVEQRKRHNLNNSGAHGERDKLHNLHSRLLRREFRFIFLLFHCNHSKSICEKLKNATAQNF